jgi:hypothetical protein
MSDMYDRSASARDVRLHRAKLMFINRTQGLTYGDISRRYSLSINTGVWTSSRFFLKRRSS